MSGSLFPTAQQWFDDDGEPLALGTIQYFIAGTSTPKNVYSDFSLSTSLGSSITLNVGGRPASQVFGSGAYKVRVTSADSLYTKTIDNVYLINTTTQLLPSQSGAASGSTLQTNGTTASWVAPDVTVDGPFVLVTDFPNIDEGNAIFDNGPGFQDALNSLIGTGITLMVPAGTFYFATGIELTSDNSLIGFDARYCILRASGAFQLISVNKSQLSTKDALVNFTLTGFSSSDTASEAILLGPASGSTSGNFTQRVRNINLTSDTWYNGITGAAELDDTVLENIQLLGGVVGNAFIDLNLSSTAVAPSAAVTIRFCHAGNQANAAFGKNRFGIRVQGTDSAAIEQCLISGFDVNYAIYSQVSGGRQTLQTSISNSLTEDFRTFVSDFSARADSTAYSVGSRRVPSPANGFVYICTTAGTSNGSPPGFTTTIGGTTTDGTVVWTNQGYNSRRWATGVSYPVNYLVKATKGNANGWVFQSSGGTSGATEPAWGGLTTIDYGTTFSDNGITWTAVHCSIAIQMKGNGTSHKLNVSSTSIGPVLVQYEMAAGSLGLTNCDFYLGASSNVSDIAFRYVGASANGALVSVNSRLSGNFKPYVTAASDSVYASVLLTNTRIQNDLLALVDGTGEGVFGYYLGDTNRPIGGGVSTSGTFTVTPVSDSVVTCTGSSTVTLADSSAMHKGKVITITALTSAGVTITPATGSFNFMGDTLGSIYLPASSSFVRLLAKTSGWEIQGSTAYIPARMRQTLGSGTNGGGFTSGSFVARTFNEESDPSVFLTTSGGTWTSFSIPRGVYVLRASAPAFGVDFHQTRLQNTTAATTVVSGSLSTAATGVQSHSQLEHIFQLTTTSSLELQHRCQTTNGTNGFGAAGSLSAEVFSTITIEKLI